VNVTKIVSAEYSDDISSSIQRLRHIRNQSSTINKESKPQSIIDLSNNVPKAGLRTFRDEQTTCRIISK
jgi:hypothetical protein